MPDETIVVVTAGAVLTPPGCRVLAHAVNGLEAMAATAEFAPDVLVLDLALTDPGTRVVCRRLRSWMPACRSLVIGDTDDDALYDAVVAGAFGALVQPTGDELRDAVDLVANDHAVLPARVAGRLLRDVDDWARRRSDPINPPPTLTATEREVLTSLARGETAIEIATRHSVHPRLVHLHAGFAVGKLHHYVLGEAVRAERQAVGRA